MSLRIQHKGAAPRRQSEAVILFTVGGHRFAIAAGAVEEIRTMDGTQALPAGPGARLSKVKRVLEREQREYYVVDANAHFHIRASQATRVLLLRRSSTAVSVDGIERMTEIEALLSLPRAFQGDERRWYRGLALVDEQVVPVVNAGSFLSRAELALLHGAARPAEGKVSGAVTA